MESSAEKTTSWKYFLIIIFCISVVYARGLNYDFVNYDDYDLVLNNESFISHPANIGTSFTTHVFTTHRKESVYYRPILLVSYIIDYQVWKLNPKGYHLTNILLHCLTTIMVFLLINSLLQNQILALFTSLFFALHPIQVESVVWIAGRNDILVGLFISMMMYFYIRHYEKPEKKNIYLLWAGLSFTLALFTKESAAFCIFLMPIYDIVMRKISFAKLFSKDSLLKLSPLAVILAIYLIIRLILFGEIAGTEKLYGMLSLIGRLKLLPAIITEHLSLLIAPFWLSVEHPLDKILWLNFPWYLVAIAAVLLMISIIVWTWRHQPQISFGVLWMAVCIFPALNIFPLAVPIFEHRLYTASIGFTIIICYGIFQLFKSRAQLIGRLLLLLLITACGIGSYLRLPVWQNSETLWLDAIEKAPSAQRAYFNLAGYYFDRQKYNKTEELLNKYIELRPDDFTGYSKLRQTYFAARQFDKALEICKRLITLDTHDQNRYVDLGVFFEKMDLPDSAIRVYQEGLRIDSTFYLLHVHLGRMYHNRGNVIEAEKHYRQSIQVKSDFAPAYFGFGILEASQGNDTLALRLLQQGATYETPTTDIAELIAFLTNKLEQIRK
jgi:tetratricopeptide (TPR) repeat protein